MWWYSWRCRLRKHVSDYMHEQSLSDCPLVNARDSFHGKSALVQGMAWCRQATRHYMSQCFPTSISPFGVIRIKWVNYIHHRSVGKYSRVPLRRDPIQHDIAYNTLLTEAENISEFVFTTPPPPNLALTGKLWGVYCEEYGENRP